MQKNLFMTSTKTPYALEVIDVHKHFGKFEALRGLSLKVESGLTYGLLGPNGAGKTTLIRSIIGLLIPDSGRVIVLGTPMPNKTILQQVGYMTQSPALYEELSVRENVRFFAVLAGMDGRESAIDDVITLVNLDAHARKQVRALSGGMKQRCSLACALVHHPRVLLLDEPTVGVDPTLRVQFWDYFRQLNRQGVTLLVSSHVMDEAERCDRLGFVREGKLLAEGTASELIARAGTSTLEDAFLHFAEQNQPQ